ncbi:hypothetical protein MM560_G102n56 [Manis javanica]|nr:hypothetical protein MM560_G102n56 [Manis javanica]
MPSPGILGRLKMSPDSEKLELKAASGKCNAVPLYAQILINFKGNSIIDLPTSHLAELEVEENSCEKTRVHRHHLGLCWPIPDTSEFTTSYNQHEPEQDPDTPVWVPDKLIRQVSTTTSSPTQLPEMK